MAISDQQIFDWLVANPTADDATIAAIMDQFDVTPADVARATGTDVADIQSRYEAVAETPTAPTVIETPTTGGLNAVSVASEPTYTSYETESGTVYEPVYEPPPARDEPIYETPSVKEEPVYEPPPPPEEPIYKTPSTPEEPVYEPPRPPKEIVERPEPPPSPPEKPIVEPPKPPVKEIVDTNVPQDKTVTQTATETTLPKITDHQGNQYDGTQLLTLARQISENAGTMTGGAFQTKGQNIGFAATEANNLLGRTATASEQVLLDMARQMIQSGVTDLSQLKTQDIKSSGVSVQIDPETNQYYALIPSADGETSTRKELTPDQVAKIKTQEVLTGGEGETSTYRTIDDLVTGKGLFANGKLLTAQDAVDNPIAYTIGATYTGGGGTSYDLKFDPKTGKSIVSANGFTTSDADTIMPIIMIASNFLMPGVGSMLTSTLVEAGMSEIVSQVVSKAVINGVTSGVMAEASGGKFGDGFLKGSITGAISAGVAPMISTALPSDLSPAVSGALTKAGTAAITALATGTDVSTAIGTQLLNSAVNTGLGSVTGGMGISTADANLLNSVLTPVVTQLVTNGNVNDATLMNAVLLAGSTILANTGSDAVNNVSTLTTGSDADKTVGGLNLLANTTGNETINNIASTVNTGLGAVSTATGLLNKATSLTKPVTKVNKTKANLTGALRTNTPKTTTTRTAAVKPAALGALNTAKKTLTAQQMSQLKASKPPARVNVANLTAIKKPPQRVDVKTLIPVKKAQLPAGLNTKKMG